MCSFSTRNVFRPALASTVAQGDPACPDPLTIESYIFGEDVVDIFAYRNDNREKKILNNGW